LFDFGSVVERAIGVMQSGLIGAALGVFAARRAAHETARPNESARPGRKG
jgi:hypothetical protein